MTTTKCIYVITNKCSGEIKERTVVMDTPEGEKPLSFTVCEYHYDPFHEYPPTLLNSPEELCHYLNCTREQLIAFWHNTDFSTKQDLLWMPLYHDGIPE